MRYKDDEKRNEILTMNIIKNDIYSDRKRHIIGIALVSLPVPFMLWLVFLMFKTAFSLAFSITFVTVLALAYALYAVYMAAKPCKTLKALKKQDITVTTDILESTREEEHLRSRGRHLRMEYSYYLIFRTHGEYKIPAVNYAWSKDFRMTDRSVELTSFKNQVFYLVVIDGKVEAAYNSMYFKPDESVKPANTEVTM